VLAFTPFTMPGTHSPAWNSRSWGIETVGEFMTEPFEPIIHDTLVACLGILHARVGLDPTDYKAGVRGLHFHKEDPKTTHKECPGVHIDKAELVRDVAAYIERLHPGAHDHVPVAVHTAPTNSLSAEELSSVAWLQNALNKTGAMPPLAVDGEAGPATRAAVKSFQRAANLVMDGIAGPVTRLKLKAAV
jgi:peptidoglycan hydrolase-like protein with peptidoglycan-binding domain